MSIALRSARHDLVDPDYEARVVGAMLLDHEAAAPATKGVEPHHFADLRMATIWRALRSIEQTGAEVTPEAVLRWLARHQVEAAGEWLAEAADNFLPSIDSLRLDRFVRRIVWLADLRLLFGVADRATLVVRDRRLDQSSRIEAAHEILIEGLAELGGW